MTVTSSSSIEASMLRSSPLATGICIDWVETKCVWGNYHFMECLELLEQYLLDDLQAKITLVGLKEHMRVGSAPSVLKDFLVDSYMKNNVSPELVLKSKNVFEFSCIVIGCKVDIRYMDEKFLNDDYLAKRSLRLLKKGFSGKLRYLFENLLRLHPNSTVLNFLSVQLSQSLQDMIGSTSGISIESDLSLFISLFCSIQRLKLAFDKKEIHGVDLETESLYNLFTSEKSALEFLPAIFTSAPRDFQSFIFSWTTCVLSKTLTPHDIASQLEFLSNLDREGFWYYLAQVFLRVQAMVDMLLVFAFRLHRSDDDYIQKALRLLEIAFNTFGPSQGCTFFCLSKFRQIYKQHATNPAGDVNLFSELEKIAVLISQGPQGDECIFSPVSIQLLTEAISILEVEAVDIRPICAVFQRCIAPSSTHAFRSTMYSFLRYLRPILLSGVTTPAKMWKKQVAKTAIKNISASSPERCRILAAIVEDLGLAAAVGD